MKTTLLFGGPLFDGETLYPDGALLFSKKGILGINPQNATRHAEACIDVQGSFILPGLVDLHSDTLEKCIEMRPGVLFDQEFALRNLDRRLAACGITTFCHALSFGVNEAGLRAPAEAAALVRTIKKFSAGGNGLVRHKVHARYEISSIRGPEVIRETLREGLVDLVSIMDHTPGQGQFKTLESYRRYYSGSFNLSNEKIDEMARKKREGQADGWRIIDEITKEIAARGLPLLSHDDDTPEKIELLQKLKVTASEFPTTATAAAAAREKGLKVFLGAPNMVRGGSSNGHLSARDAIQQDLCDGLISDYYPECLPQSPFIADRVLGIGLKRAFCLVTSGPGRFLDAEGSVGFFKPGLPADITVISDQGPWAEVLQTWVDGTCIYRGTARLSS